MRNGSDPVAEATGYLHPAYADSLREFGAPRLLPGCGGTILQREIPRSDAWDAIGPYPLFACRDWSLLRDDVDALRGELAALSLVTDPFGDYAPDDLRGCFPEMFVAFKDHYVVDLSVRLESHVQLHHRRNAGKALRTIEVERRADPPLLLDEWTALYDNLIRRREIAGIPAFSREAFAKQLKVPGLVAFRAEHGRRTVGMHLWYVQREVAYYHLGAYSDEGYRVLASFALFWRALEHFASSGLAWACLGGGVGLGGGSEDGLSRFKRGWSTATRAAYFCGVILEPGTYGVIVESRGGWPTKYFPAYRQGEFA
jgi:hypothetical protein